MEMNCHYCGIEWRLAVPLKYHGEEDKPNRWHCFDDECVEKCDRCKSSAEENILPPMEGLDRRSDSPV